MTPVGAKNTSRVVNIEEGAGAQGTSEGEEPVVLAWDQIKEQLNQ